MRGPVVVTVVEGALVITTAVALGSNVGGPRACKAPQKLKVGTLSTQKVPHKGPTVGCLSNMGFSMTLPEQNQQEPVSFTLRSHSI